MNIRHRKLPYGTVGHCLRKLPTSARIKARKIITENGYNLTSKVIGVHDAHSALYGLMQWGKTPHGAGYWNKIVDYVSGRK